MAANALFEPFVFGKITLRNRVVMAPMTRGLSPGGVPGPKVAAYYRRRAEGGVGLIISEGTYIEDPAAAGFSDVPRFYGEKSLQGWAEVLKEVHAAGGRMIPQLWHVGSNRPATFDRERQIPYVSASAQVYPGLRSTPWPRVPKALSESEIADIIRSFARSAAQAEALGFDGVEIHGAHGYLIDQFFWSETNQRGDRYGGRSLGDRSRFAVEVVEAIRKAVAPEFPVVFRFSQWKGGLYDAKLALSPQGLEQMLKPLLKAGVDVFHASTRHFDQPEFDGSPLNLAGWTKKITGLPTITVGSVGLSTDFISERRGETTQPAALKELEDRLARKEFDLVAVGRALLGDPHWVLKVQAGRFNEITPYDPKNLSELL